LEVNLQCFRAIEWIERGRIHVGRALRNPVKRSLGAKVNLAKGLLLRITVN